MIFGIRKKNAKNLSQRLTEVRASYETPSTQLRMRYNSITTKIETGREDFPGLHKKLSIIVKELALRGINNVMVQEEG